MENSNSITAHGTIAGALVYSHTILGEPFYTSTLLVPRLSGTVDQIPVTIPGKLLALMPIDNGTKCMLNGQVRSYNKVVDGSGRLMVTLFAQSLEEAQNNAAVNDVSLTGVLCKPPIYRSTPFGREICDMMLAVNRGFGKSDYIPCIAWGRNAKYASSFHVGDKMRITGRLQSREYQKLYENGEYMTRIAYEVSASTVDCIKDAVAM